MKGIAKVEAGNRRAALYSLIQESIQLNRDEEKRYRELVQTDPVYKEAKMFESVEEVCFEDGFEKGGMVKEILASEQMLGQNLFSEKELREKNLDELEEILEEYRARKPLEFFEEAVIGKGKLIGEIQMSQRILRQAVDSEQELKKKPLDELKEILAELESRLSAITFH